MSTPIGEASVTQQKTLAIVPKVSSMLSLLGSIYIIYDVLKLKPSRRKMYHRIMLGMSTCDALASLAWFFTTWPIPPEVLPIWGASGNQQTCDVQGFFAQLSISSVVYNGCLAVYYFIVINLGWSQRKLKQRRVELYMHVISILSGLVTSSVSVGLGLMNPIGWDCWIAAVPLGCRESFSNGGETTCIRGDNSNMYQWIFFYGPLWIITVGVTVAMAIILRKFSKQEEKRSRYGENSIRKAMNREQSIRMEKGREQTSRISMGRTNSRKSRLLTDLKRQNCLYVGSFYFTWLFPTILRITELTGDVVYFHWVMLSASFVPIQGLLNMIVYLVPQYRKIRKIREIKEKQQQIREEQDQHAGNVENDFVDNEQTERKPNRFSIHHSIHKSIKFEAIMDMKKAFVTGDNGTGAKCESVITGLSTSIQGSIDMEDDGGIAMNPPDAAIQIDSPSISPEDINVNSQPQTVTVDENR